MYSQTRKRISSSCVKKVVSFVRGNFLVFQSVLITTLLLGSCGRIPNAVESEDQASIEIRAIFSDIQSNLQKASKVNLTEADSLIIEVTGVDMAPIRQVKKINKNKIIIIDTFPKIPAGDMRYITIKAVNRFGKVTHVDSSGTIKIKINPGEMVSLNSVLIPSCGSIYIQLGSIPTSVDSVVANFTSNSETWSVRQKRSSKVNFSIDNIPHLTKGKLTVAGLNTSGDTLYVAQTEITFDARKQMQIPLSFSSKPASTNIGVTLQSAGVTLVTSEMSSQSIGAETEIGGAIITEIMYSANDSEYIEISNTTQSEINYDTMYLEIDGSRKVLVDIKIPALGAVTIGRIALPWINYIINSSTFMDLSSNGNWISIRNKQNELIDRVIFDGNDNGLEWPNIKDKSSIILKSEINDKSLNNFGSNWIKCAEPISSGATGTTQNGTPRVR